VRAVVITAAQGERLVLGSICRLHKTEAACRRILLARHYPRTQRRGGQTLHSSGYLLLSPLELATP
jgi:hypothetical protein